MCVCERVYREEESSLCPQAAGQLQTCSLLRMPAGASLPLPPPRSTRRPPSPPLARGALRSGCLVLEAVQPQLRRWLSGRAAEGAGEPGAHGRTLLPRGRRLPWKYFSSFASAVTAPMVTQDPLAGGGGVPPLGARWEEVDRGGGNVAGEAWGCREGEQVAGLVLTPRQLLPTWS